MEVKHVGLLPTARQDRHRWPGREVHLQEYPDRTRPGGVGPIQAPKRDPVRWMESSLVGGFPEARHLVFHLTCQLASRTFAVATMPWHMEFRHGLIQFPSSGGIPHKWL